MDWDGSTNFDGVFDLILQQAVLAKLPQEQMIQQVVCYSDMEFNVSRRLVLCMTQSQIVMPNSPISEALVTARQQAQTLLSPCV